MKTWIPFILILASVGIFFVVIDPQYDEIKELKFEREDNEATIRLAKELESKRGQLHADFNKISNEDREHLQKLLPDTVDNVRLILDINNISETFGIAIRDISIESEEGSNGEGDSGDFVDNTVIDNTASVGTITLGFSVSATYDTFKALMEDLENSLRVVDIRTLTIGGAGTENIFYDFDVVLDTYWLR